MIVTTELYDDGIPVGSAEREVHEMVCQCDQISVVGVCISVHVCACYCN